jgi:hypothetical protein
MRADAQQLSLRIELLTRKNAQPIPARGTRFPARVSLP